MRHFPSILMFFLIGSSVLPSFATNYYVSNAGSDTNSGLSLVEAYLTIQHAADFVNAGDTVFVENGTYVGFDVRDVNGTAGSPIVFKGLGSNVLINQSGPVRNDGINIENADYIVIDGFYSNNMPGNGNGIRVVISDHCVVRNCVCDNNAERGIFTGFTDDILIEYNICTNSIDEHGIYVSNSSDRPIIRFNECYGNNAIGIHLNADASLGGDGIISDAQIYGNIIHDNNRAAGINMDGLENPVVYNNLIYNNHFAQGIALFQQDGAIVTNGAKIYNNTIIVPSDGRWGIHLTDGANVKTEIYNNIIINQHAWRGCITVEAIAQMKSDYNILNDKMSDMGDGGTIAFSEWQTLGFDTHSQIADPLPSIFMDPAANDYQLADESQAIDAGTNLVSTIVMVDLDGVTRPSGMGYDIGAFERTITTQIKQVGITELGIIIAPNPVQHQFTISGNGDAYDIQILNIKGQCISQIKNQTLPYTFDSSQWQNGHYTIKIEDKTSHQTGVGTVLKVD
ncbi:MAG: right-handed parallel beta-helix repeat-containing protein [Saprospiraceae bacterium]|nr:right-handed parallel beta-helix repeat-containing protein [Saprospiraceae bacterium]